MMKKIISILMIISICFCGFPLSVAAGKESQKDYSKRTETVYHEYLDHEKALRNLFDNDESFGYWRFINGIEENKAIKSAINISSILIGELPEKKDYVEILTNLMTMQSGDLAEQIEKQSQFDHIHGGKEYTEDIVEIVQSFVGGADVLENISEILDAVKDGAEVSSDIVEQGKYYEMILKDYSQSKGFLEAISNYADDKKLRKAAKELISANDLLLEKRLEYLSYSAEELSKYEAKFFFKEMSFEILRETDQYQKNDTIKWMADQGSELLSSISTLKSSGGFAFRMTMLIGDVGFGTSNMFNRYQEMKVVSDIAEALIKANSYVKLPKDFTDPETLNIIQIKCDYYKMLIATHARGEYLLYQLLINDAGLLSQFRVLTDFFKEAHETTESKYRKQINVMLEYMEILDGITEVGDESTAIPEELSAEQICDAMKNASQFAWDWFWDSSREVVDENDTHKGISEDGTYNLEYKRVQYENIHSVQDILDLTKHYFTEDIAKQLVSQKQWYEAENKLYMSEPDGIGGAGADSFEIYIEKESEIKYGITVWENWEDKYSEPYEVTLTFVDGYWVFDQRLVQIPDNINVIDPSGRWKKAYSEIIKGQPEKVKEEYPDAYMNEELLQPSYLLYFLGDLNGDAIKELLIENGTCRADMKWDVYTISESGEAVFIDEIPGSGWFYKRPEGGAYMHYQQMGEEDVYLITFNGDEIKKEWLYTGKTDTESTTLFSKADELDWSCCDDYSILLQDNQWNSSFYGRWSNDNEADSTAENLDIVFESDEALGEVSATIGGREKAIGIYFKNEDGTFSADLIIDSIYNNANMQWESAYAKAYLRGKMLDENSMECEFWYENSSIKELYYLKHVN